jgi:hypothetical protein
MKTSVKQYRISIWRALSHHVAELCGVRVNLQTDHVAKKLLL